MMEVSCLHKERSGRRFWHRPTSRARLCCWQTQAAKLAEYTEPATAVKSLPARATRVPACNRLWLKLRSGGWLRDDCQFGAGHAMKPNTEAVVERLANNPSDASYAAS